MGRAYVQFSPEVVDELWSRLRAGMAAKPAARELGMSPGTVRAYLVRCGGVRPVPRRRAQCRLTVAEREEISRGLAAGVSVRAIAADLGRAPSTVSREVARNGGRPGYRAVVADRSAWARATRPKTCKLARNRVLRDIVEAKLRSRWSPEQIAGWLARRHPDEPEWQVSHETIYRTLFVQSRGALALRTSGGGSSRVSVVRGRGVEGPEDQERPSSLFSRTSTLLNATRCVLVPTSVAGGLDLNSDRHARGVAIAPRRKRVERAAQEALEALAASMD